MVKEVTAEDIQAIAREMQHIRSQIQTVSSQISEYGVTIDALENQDPDRPVYRSFGNILLEVEDMDSLSEGIKESKEALESHLNRLAERESELRKEYERLAEAFEKGGSYSRERPRPRRNGGRY